MKSTCYPTVLGLALALAAPVMAQQEVPDIQVEPINDHLYMLVGMGGNIALSTGKDATFIVDDQMAPIVPKLKAAIADITPREVDFILNTHWHFDHTGGNELLGEAGALIVAHDNVYTRMSTPQTNTFFNSTRPPSPEVARPVVTFDNTTTIRLNGDTIHVTHVPNAHTDGDVHVFFEESNVYHLGDTYFTQTFPYFDLDSNGSLDGMIASAERVLGFADEDAIIIPGHGPISGIDRLREYRDMLVTVRARVAKLIERGATFEQVLAAQPTRDFEDEWGGSEFMPAERWLTIVYRDLSKTE